MSSGGSKRPDPRRETETQKSRPDCKIAAQDIKKTRLQDDNPVLQHTRLGSLACRPTDQEKLDPLVLRYPMGCTILEYYVRRVPLPTVPSTIVGRVAPYGLTLLQDMTQQIWNLAFSGSTYQIHSKLWLYIIEFDLTANTQRKRWLYLSIIRPAWY